MVVPGSLLKLVCVWNSMCAQVRCGAHAAGREARRGRHLPPLPAAPLHVQHLLQGPHSAHDQDGPPAADVHAAHHPVGVPVPGEQEVGEGTVLQ